MADPKRALVISAHPDDIEFGCAATVAQLVDDGWGVRYVIVTSGQRGTQDPEAGVEEVAAVRERESRQAAQAVGVDDLVFLGYLDGDLIAADPLALRRDLSREFRRHRPHRLITMEPAHAPSDRFVNHPDHRAVGTAALDITITGGTTGAIFPELALDEGLPPWRELEEVWLFGPVPGGLAVDVTATLERKIAALRAHVSQIGDWDVEQAIREWLSAAGEPHGYDFAETFRVINFRR